MKSLTWYNDAAAKRAHDMLTDELKTIVARLFPNYELSHTGINRNSVTEEVQIRLHLNPIGSVKVVVDHGDLRLPP